MLIFDAAIHPSLDGRIFLDQTLQGGGGSNAVRAWNEFMLVQSLALRQAGNNDRAIATKHRWLSVENIRQSTYDGFATLTDTPGKFAPAFWVQQQHFLNGDFRHSTDFQTYFRNQQLADQSYSATILGEPFRYGLTAGVSPGGYHADRIQDHPSNVFSPEAVAAWGDLDSLLQFYNEQLPTTDPRYRYGMVRVSGDDPSWVPGDAGLVDHLFLLFGLVESLDADFFSDRLFPSLLPGDFNLDGLVDAADFTIWQDTHGSTSDLRADGDMNGVVGPEDYLLWRDHFGTTHRSGGSFYIVAEPDHGNAWPMVVVWVALCHFRRQHNLPEDGAIQAV